MIDLEKERVVSLTTAAAYLPRRRAGKRPHMATLYRWASRGIQGIHLETIRVGGTLCTSREALQRFCERLSTERAAVPPRPPSKDTGRNRVVAEKLDRAGIGCAPISKG